ncbi:MAG: hypothetical protein ABJF11_00190 [Reichenbachiella sp.]|uniref:hypothetical protein n=1 Tax=Reichenbachiella sp. TaxID=2184521 RepID=UPI0032653C7D
MSNIYMFKGGLIGFLVICSFTNGVSQPLKLVKEEVLNMADFENDLKTEGARKRSKYTRTFDDKNSPLTSFPEANSSSRQNARLRGSYNGIDYYVVSDDNTRTQTVVKKMSGKEIILKEFPQEGQLSTIGKKGNFLFSDIAHGAGSSYEFYSSNLKLINTYYPYEQFSFSSFIVLNENVIIWSKKEDLSRVIKLSKLTLDGILISENETEIPISAVLRIIAKHEIISILLSGPSFSTRLLLTFNKDLELLRSENIGDVLRNELILTDDKELIYSSSKAVHAIDIKSGKEKWKYPISRNQYFRMVLNNKYIAIIQQHKLYKELILLDKSSGYKAYSDSISIGSGVPRIITDGEQFFLKSDNVLLKFKKAK